MDKPHLHAWLFTEKASKRSEPSAAQAERAAVRKRLQQLEERRRLAGECGCSVEEIEL